MMRFQKSSASLLTTLIAANGAKPKKSARCAYAAIVWMLSAKRRKISNILVIWLKPCNALPALPGLSSLHHQRLPTLFALDLLKIKPKITDCVAVGF